MASPTSQSLVFANILPMITWGKTAQDTNGSSWNEPAFRASKAAIETRFFSTRSASLCRRRARSAAVTFRPHDVLNAS